MRAVKKSQPVLVTDIESRPELKRDIGSASTPMRSFIGIPLIVGSELIGTLELGSMASGAFRQEDLDLVRLLSGQAAIAARANIRAVSAVMSRRSCRGIRSRPFLQERAVCPSPSATTSVGCPHVALRRRNIPQQGATIKKPALYGIIQLPPVHIIRIERIREFIGVHQQRQETHIDGSKNH